MAGILEEDDECVEDLGRKRDGNPIAEQTPFGRLEPHRPELIELTYGRRHQWTVKTTEF